MFYSFWGMPCCSQTYESTQRRPSGETHQGSGREVIPSKQRQRNDGFGNSGRREGVGMPLKVSELQSLLDLFVFKEYSPLKMFNLKNHHFGVSMFSSGECVYDIIIIYPRFKIISTTMCRYGFQYH